MPSIRLIGAHHTSHDDGAVLQVTTNVAAAANNHNIVTLENARALVARGDAEWAMPPNGMVEPAADPAPAALINVERLHRERLAIAASLAGADYESPRYDVLYIAQQALSWAIDAEGAGSPLDVINKFFPVEQPAAPEATQVDELAPEQETAVEQPAPIDEASVGDAVSDPEVSQEAPAEDQPAPDEAAPQEQPADEAPAEDQPAAEADADPAAEQAPQS